MTKYEKARLEMAKKEVRQIFHCFAQGNFKKIEAMRKGFEKEGNYSISSPEEPFSSRYFQVKDPLKRAKVLGREIIHLFVKEDFECMKRLRRILNQKPLLQKTVAEALRKPENSSTEKDGQSLRNQEGLVGPSHRFSQNQEGEMEEDLRGEREKSENFSGKASEEASTDSNLPPAS